MYLNKVFLIGNVTRDIELKIMPTGSKIANFSIATNRTWKDANGQKKEAVEYHTIVAFAKTAETIGQYVSKGQQLFIEGRLQTRSWEGADGKKNYSTEIVVDNFQFGAKPASASTNISKLPEVIEDEKTIEYPDENIDLDDIPF